MVFDLVPQEDPEPIDIFDRNCVLILDQDKSHLEYLKLVFTQQKFKVLSHTSGEYGLKTAQKSQPDCIVVNTDLVDMDGLDLCQALVDDSQTCGIPVICIGNSRQPEIVPESKASGCQYYVAQPVDPRTVVFLVNESIAEARSWICE